VEEVTGTVVVVQNIEDMAYGIMGLGLKREGQHSGRSALAGGGRYVRAGFYHRKMVSFWWELGKEKGPLRTVRGLHP